MFFIDELSMVQRSFEFFYRRLIPPLSWNYPLFHAITLKAKYINRIKTLSDYITTLKLFFTAIFCFNAKNGIYCYHAIMLELSKKFFTYFFAWNTQRKSLQKGSKDWTVLFFLLSSFKLLYKLFYSLFIFVEHYFRFFYSPSFIFM